LETKPFKRHSNALSYEEVLKREQEKRKTEEQQIQQQQQSSFPNQQTMTATITPQKQKSLIPGLKLPQQPQQEQQQETKKSKHKQHSNFDPVLGKIPKEIAEMANQSTIPSLLADEDEQRNKFKTFVSEEIVKRLSVHFKDGKIPTKEDFKFFSRKLTHKILLDSNWTQTTTTPEKLKKYVDKYLNKKGGSLVMKNDGKSSSDQHKPTKRK